MASTMVNHAQTGHVSIDILKEDKRNMNPPGRAGTQSRRIHQVTTSRIVHHPRHRAQSSSRRVKSSISGSLSIGGLIAKRQQKKNVVPKRSSDETKRTPRKVVLLSTSKSFKGHKSHHKDASKTLFTQALNARIRQHESGSSSTNRGSSRSSRDQQQHRPSKSMIVEPSNARKRDYLQWS